MVHRQVMSTETIVENYPLEILGNKVWTKMPPKCTAADQAKDLKKNSLCVKFLLRSTVHVLKSHSALPRSLIKTVTVKWQDRKWEDRASQWAQEEDDNTSSGTVSTSGAATSMKLSISLHIHSSSQNKRLVLCPHQCCEDKTRVDMITLQEKRIYFWRFTLRPSIHLFNLSTTQEVTSSLTLFVLLLV